MFKLLKWMLRIATFAFALGAVALAVAYLVLKGSLPDYDKDYAVRGLDAPLEIVRDNASVPHIFGQTDADSFFGLGYAHAEDRLWQMLVFRRTAQGKLSEVFGLPTVDIDKFVRRLDIYGLARSSVAVQDERTMMALEAYARGVNARLQEINDEALGRGAPEMYLFNHAIAPWVPADSIAILKLMALQLAGHMDAEILRARTSLMLEDEARLLDILPDAPGAGIAALPDYEALLGVDLPRYAANTPRPTSKLSPFPARGLQGASNAWAAAPRRSATQGALLAGDPHLGFTAPAIWYLARLELEKGGVIGATIPGLPTILAGRSETMGWTVTSSYLDDQDVYIEELNPENPEEYRTPDGFKPFITRKSILEIKGEPPVTMTLRWTDNGPVLPTTSFDLNTVTPAGHVPSLAWTVLTPRDTTMTAAIDLLYADSLDEALEAGENFISPSQNLTLVEGDRIAIKTLGAMPKRDPRHESQGRLPSLGWKPQNRWQGRMPYADNPAFIDPEGGIIGNTNNKMVDRPFPHHVSFKYGDTQRVNRWRRLMQERRVHTRESFTEAQLDTVSFTARALLPLIGADLWFTGEAAPDGTPERLRQRALELLANWNGEMNEHLPEPLIYAAWLRALQERLIEDDLGPLAREFTHVEPLFIERVYRDVDGASAWCDVAQSSPVETCTDIARLALDDALVWISETYGTALDSLRWGDAHQATHDHPVLGDVPVLRYFVNIRQSTSGGDNTLMRGRTKGTGNNPFLNVHGAGYRGVYDFADPDSSQFIISTGQSGHFLSRHYDDMAQLWRRGEYIPMSLDENLARAAAVGVTRLEPRPE